MIQRRANVAHYRHQVQNDAITRQQRADFYGIKSFKHPRVLSIVIIERSGCGKHPDINNNVLACFNRAGIPPV